MWNNYIIFQLTLQTRECAVFFQTTTVPVNDYSFGDIWQS